MKNKKLFIKILLIALAVVVLGGVAGGIYYYQSRKAKVIENNEDSGSTGIDTTNWKIYRDSIEGYSFKYPFISVPNSLHTILQGIENGNEKIVIVRNEREKDEWPRYVVSAYKTDESLDNYIDKTVKLLVDDYKINKDNLIISDVTVGGIQGKKLFTKGDKNSNNTVINIPYKKGVLLQITGDTSDSEKELYFNTFVNTFEFIENNIPTNWKTYRNEEYGFEIQYPSDFLTPVKTTLDSSIVEFIAENHQSSIFSIQKFNTLEEATNYLALIKYYEKEKEDYFLALMGFMGNDTVVQMASSFRFVEKQNNQSKASSSINDDASIITNFDVANVCEEMGLRWKFIEGGDNAKQEYYQTVTEFIPLTRINNSSNLYAKVRSSVENDKNIIGIGVWRNEKGEYVTGMGSHILEFYTKDGDNYSLASIPPIDGYECDFPGTFKIYYYSSNMIITVIVGGHETSPSNFYFDGTKWHNMNDLVREKLNLSKEKQPYFAPFGLKANKDYFSLMEFKYCCAETYWLNKDKKTEIIFDAKTINIVNQIQYNQ